MLELRLHNFGDFLEAGGRTRGRRKADKHEINQKTSLVEDNPGDPFTARHVQRVWLCLLKTRCPNYRRLCPNNAELSSFTFT